MSAEKLTSKYPDALRLADYESGRFYTLFNRTFQKAVETGKSVIFAISEQYFQYHFDPSHRSFEEGCEALEQEFESSMRRIMEAVDHFELSAAIHEAGYIRLPDGTLKEGTTDEVMEKLKITQGENGTNIYIRDMNINDNSLDEVIALIRDKTGVMLMFGSMHKRIEAGCNATRNSIFFYNLTPEQAKIVKDYYSESI